MYTLLHVAFYAILEPPWRSGGGGYSAIVVMGRWNEAKLLDAKKVIQVLC